MSSNQPKLTVMAHLAELRRRLIWSFIAVAIGTAVASIFYEQLFAILIRPAQSIELVYIEMTEMLGTTMKVCITAGLALAVPFITYQVLMYVAPALTRREKRYVYLILPWIFLMFLGGVVFGYFVLVPPATKFLMTFGSEIATPQIKVGNYVSVITRLLLSIGLVFELPLVTTFLAAIGVLKPSWLSEKRKMSVIFAFVLAAMITPTFDPVNQSLVALPLVVLYEISIWLARLVYRRRDNPALPPEATG